MLIENAQYISQVVKPKYSLDAMLWSKPVSDIDPLTLTPIHHRGKATLYFPNERQRLQVPAVCIRCGDTGARGSILALQVRAATIASGRERTINCRRDR